MKIVVFSRKKSILLTPKFNTNSNVNFQITCAIAAAVPEPEKKWAAENLAKNWAKKW